MTLTRQHDTQHGWREATYSDCEKYRYSLRIAWAKTGSSLLCVMLNPSKATELANDPTIERCERRARHLGFSRLEITNLFALRETSPERLKASKHPEGQDNLAMVEMAVKRADQILLAWGVHGTHRSQNEKLLPIFLASGKAVVHLGRTKHGHPRHPLYVPYATKPMAW